MLSWCQPQQQLSLSTPTEEENSRMQQFLGQVLQFIRSLRNGQLRRQVALTGAENDCRRGKSLKLREGSERPGEEYGHEASFSSCHPHISYINEEKPHDWLQGKSFIVQVEEGFIHGTVVLNGAKGIGNLEETLILGELLSVPR